MDSTRISSSLQEAKKKREREDKVKCAPGCPGHASTSLFMECAADR